MPAANELQHFGGRHIGFDIDLFAADPLPTRGIKSLLRIEVPVNQIFHNLHMRLRLHEAAHDAKGSDGFALFGEETGNDRVIRTFAALQTISVSRIKTEVFHAIVHRNAGARNDNA